MTDNTDFSIRKDETTGETFVTLNDTDLEQFRFGMKQNKSPKVFMTSEPLIKLNDLMTQSDKQIFVGNESRGFQKIQPFGIKHIQTIGIFR